jgi:hypothetical protein
MLNNGGLRPMLTIPASSATGAFRRQPLGPLATNALARLARRRR